MSRSSPLIRWMPVIALILLPISTVIVVDAGSATAPMLGFTPTATATDTATPTQTPTATETVTPTPTPTKPPTQVCIPVITKWCDPAVAARGEEVKCAIVVKNEGQKKAEEVQITDHLPDYLAMTLDDVVVDPKDQVQKMELNGHELVIDLGIIGKDINGGKGVEVVIRARVREDAPPSVCVENLVEFSARYCPDREAATICTYVPETGGSSLWWTVAGGLGTVLLVLSLVLAQRHRS